MTRQAILMREMEPARRDRFRGAPTLDRLYRLTEPHVGHGWLLARSYWADTRVKREKVVWWLLCSDESGEPGSLVARSTLSPGAQATPRQVLARLGYEEVVP